MTTTLTETTHVLPGFDAEAFSRLPTTEPAAIRAHRTAAFEAYASLENPTNQHEEYRRTNPIRFGFGKVEPLAAPAWGREHVAGDWDEAFDAVLLVREDGINLHDPNGVVDGQSLIVESLIDWATRDPEGYAARYGAEALTEGPRKVQCLVDAFWNVGLHIVIDDKVKLEKGLLVRYELETEGAAMLTRFHLEAGKQAEGCIVEHYSSPDGVRTLFAEHRECYVEPAANVRVVSVQQWGDTAVHLGEDWARVKRDAVIDLVTLSLGGKTSKMMVGCDVCEPNANAYLGGLYFAHDKQHFDQKTLQRHSSPDTYSNMLYKGAAKDSGHSVYQGFIQATPGSIRVDSYQTNNNLLLTPGARADSIPGLIIDADDLACSHGATMGNLDPAEIYYLRARGIPDNLARKMLVLGFFEEVVERVPQEIVRDRLHEVIEQKLGV